VKKASAEVEGKEIGRIGPGLVLLIGIRIGDEEKVVRSMADKCVHLRIFEDEAGRMNRSLLETEREILAIPQFTLYGDCRKGRRPNFMEAAPPPIAEELYKKFVDSLREKGIRVDTGEFGAKMLVDIHNDGPVTLILEG